jgi:anti-sigma B factor antagonist
VADLWDHTITRVGDTCTVSLFGEIDMSCSDELIILLTTAVQGRSADAIHVDLADVGFMDSSGIHALLTGHRAAKAAGLRLMVVRPQHHVRRVLEIAGVLAILTGEDAVGSPGGN